MSREVKRVPLDFDAPLGKTWEPLVLPKRLRADPCPDCAHGYTPAHDWLEVLCSRISMLGQDIGYQRLAKPMHPWLSGDGYAPGRFVGDDYRSYVGFRPTPDIVPLLAGLRQVDEARVTDPHGSLDGGRIMSTLIAASGVDSETWGICPTCNGTAGLEAYPGQAAEREAWEPAEIPTGDGWQLWQTVSDGGPESPVFDDAESLAVWLASPESGRERMSSLDAARRFVAAGWAPSGADIGAGYQTGTEWVASMAAARESS